MPNGSLVEAEVSAGGISIQLISHEWPSPVDAVFSEAETEHVVALQCQPPQARSTGRFCGGPAGRTAGRFGEIGRILAMPAGTPLHVVASGGPVRAVRCAFSPDTFRRLGGAAEWHSPRSLDSALDIRNRRIGESLRRLGEEARAPGFASTLLVEALGTTLMIDLSRHFESGASPAAGPIRGGLTHRQLRIITERIESEEMPPALGDLARIAGVSRRHLSRAFLQTTGYAVHEFVERSRFRKAGEMLEHSELLLKDIAYRLGFAHACSFSTAFRKLAGETPNSYRRRVRSPR